MEESLRALSRAWVSEAQWLYKLVTALGSIHFRIFV